MQLDQEKKLWKRGFKFIVGIDEVGRGPLAGPVFACAVILDKKININDLGQVNDSKQISEKKRKELYKILIKHSQIKYGIGKCSEKIIDKINIKNASELAMERALNNLKKKIKKNEKTFLLIDGKYLKNLTLKLIPHQMIIKGDGKVFSIACASIIAKVERDNLMEKYHKKYPKYGFNKHKGYPTKVHRKNIKKHGLSEIHRKTFNIKV